jgi:transcriptional regulator with XRE-family HTH domain
VVCTQLRYSQNTVFEALVDREEFLRARKKLGKTQRQLAELLCTSLKAIHSYEQGWRSIPASVERQILFLVCTKTGIDKEKVPCWVIKNCTAKCKRQCPAWELQAGEFCWFINGTICEGIVHKDWNEKIKICRRCEVFATLL